MFKRIPSLAIALALCATALFLPEASAADAARYPGAHTLALSSVQNADGTWTHGALLDGKAVEEFDYVWHADPSAVHDEVKNAPAEYYTGTKPETDAAAYIAHDVSYFPELPESGFTRVRYDDEQEWAYYYTDGKNDEYIFATLPVREGRLPSDMMHGAGDAYENAVLHVAEPGTYLLSGVWHGQIWIDLGDTDDTFVDENARVTLVLDGVSAECTVARRSCSTASTSATTPGRIARSTAARPTRRTPAQTSSLRTGASTISAAGTSTGC